MRSALAVLGLAAACSGRIEGSIAGAPDASEPDETRAPDAPSALPDAGPPCPTVAHIGDSLTYYTGDALTAAYGAVGASARLDAYGGRGVLQKLPADPKTGKQAALDFRAAGFDGCWVVALGTNDTADVAAGANYTRATDIDAMMEAIDPDRRARVLWVNVFTKVSSGSYANANMVLFNQALIDATTRWPNLRVFDWATIAAGGSAPYLSDGIHHTAAGYAVRNAAIAGALRLLQRPR
jgi:lysophospholipase L1-like esterase